jgi:hypothetical protein
MLSYTDLGMALLVIAALVAAIALINRHPEAGRRHTMQTVPPTAPPRPYVRMTDDPSQSLGRRKEDEVGGES